MSNHAAAFGNVSLTVSNDMRKGQDRTAISYRKDIDGLRAVAVIAVIVFHLGLAPAGYLGVDIFFVISGYLITSIIIKDVACGEFSFAYFYERRARRIIPLALVASLVAMVASALLMLPDDLENLAQSVVATNIFSNNILQATTTRNYWDVVNEYKPLMHTWSLGIEEQFYIFWPFAIIAAFALSVKWKYLMLYTICAVSFILFLSPFSQSDKFYYLPFRLFELAAGGLVAMAHMQGTEKFIWGQAGLPILVVLLFLGQGLPGEALVILTVGATCMIMAASSGGWYSRILENRVFVYLGLISFSLYMWHQIVFSLFRYSFVEDLVGVAAIAAVAITLALSVLSYTYIERVFRDRKKISLRMLCTTMVGLFLVGTSSALLIYSQGGVIRDVPELGLKVGQGIPGVHARYNHRVNDLNRDFSTDKAKILVVGNSFARDWANILLSTEWAKQIEISYAPELLGQSSAMKRAKQADLIFWSEAPLDQMLQMEKTLQEKIYVVGTKNFGRSAGIFYNYSGDNYFQQRVKPGPEWLQLNHDLRASYDDRYVDLMAPLLDEDDTVPVFTPDGRFISQDCRHLTIAGAEYLGRVLEQRIDVIFTNFRLQRPQGARL
ncbi:acyltransferase family protein [Aquamicrobium segne]|uniref:Acyltransferase family protein n=1 Tax=Aquamicrobium segne TaxID=469547 RepID=A0ABW0GWN4_9HYPH